MAMKENSKIVYNYVKENDGEKLTAIDIANATGLSIKSVTGIITAAFCRHKDADGNIVPLMERSAPVGVIVDGVAKTVRFISLTDAGRKFDIENA